MLGFCLVAMPVLASAAGLGKLSVFSALSEPLNAEIEVLSTTQDELDSLSATLASPEVYAEQGVERSAIPTGIKVDIVKKEGGQAIVKLSTDQPVSETFLDMIILLSWKDGSIWREYSLLLDPRGYANSAVSTPNVAAQADAGAVAKEDAAAPLAAKSIKVQKGDTLNAIAQRAPVQGVSLEQMLAGLYAANKNAFAGSNINRLRSGQTLAVPADDVLKSINQADAKALVRAHATDWHDYTNKLAGLVADNSATNGANNQANTGKVETKTKNTDLPSEAAAKDVVKLSKAPDAHSKADQDAALQDDLAAKQNAIDETDKKTAEVEKQVADMQKLLAIKNKAMADVQSNAEAQKSGAVKPPEFVTLLETINPLILKTVALIIAFFAFITFLLRRKNNEPAGLDFGTQPADEDKAEVANHEQEEAASHSNSLNLSGISLDLEPVAAAAEPVQEIKPIPDAFNGDFSNLLKIKPAETPTKVNEAEAHQAPGDDSAEVETKIELAAAYIDMRDKRGAKKLLTAALKEGSASQQARAQALIDKLS